MLEVQPGGALGLPCAVLASDTLELLHTEASSGPLATAWSALSAPLGSLPPLSWVAIGGRLCSVITHRQRVRALGMQVRAVPLPRH